MFITGIYYSLVKFRRIK